MNNKDTKSSEHMFPVEKFASSVGNRILAFVARVIPLRVCCYNAVKPYFFVCSFVYL
jgi:hypothetical protein